LRHDPQVGARPRTDLPMLSRSLATLISVTLLAASTVTGQSESDELSTIRGRKLTIVKDNAGAQAVTGVPRGYALIVGISNYKNLDAKRQLRFAESDAQSIYRLLISKEAGAFP